MTPLRFGVVGAHVETSRSPAMHAAAYRALGLPHRYEALKAADADLPALVAALRRGDYAGLNVTVPHKRRALELADDASPAARAVGAANTLVRGERGRVTAHNTDAPALVAELRALGPVAPGARGLVLGSGGAARAAAFALAELGAGAVATRARDGASARALAEHLRATVAGASRFVAEPLAPDAAREAEVGWIVQATSAGMQGADPGDVVAAAVAWDAVPRGAVALDVVYAPPNTPFLAAARARGLASADGLGMLARQGALAFELWLGIAAPYAVMRAALTT